MDLMKRLFSIIAAICCIFSTAGAEMKYSLRADIPGEDPSREITMSIYGIEKNIYADSSLLPGKIIRLDADWGVFPSVPVFEQIRPAQIFRALTESEEAFLEWIGQMPDSIKRKGRFSGELFDQASECRSVALEAKELAAYHESCMENENLQDRQKDSADDLRNMIMAYLKEQLQNIPQYEKACVLAETYNSGAYLSLDFRVDGQTVLTVSYDRSEEHKRKTLVSYRKQGRYYYEMYDLNGTDDSLTCRSGLYSAESQSFRNAAGDDALLTGELSMTADSAESCSVSETLYPRGLQHPLVVSGTIEGKTVRMKACIEGSDNIFMTLEATEEENGPDHPADESTVLRTDDPKEREDITNTMLIGFLPVLAELMKAVPDEYQKILTNLF